jgi:hypothetical protein
MRTKLIGFIGVMTGLLFMFPTAVVPAPDNASGPTNIVPLASYRFQDRHYLCAVMASNYIRGPHWQSASAEPPLSPRSALVIAERHAWRLVPDSVSFKAQEIVLKRFAGVWFYIVQLEPSNPKSPHTGGPMEPIKIAVLMDGTVAERIEQHKSP